VKAPLADVLSVLLPRPASSALLRACLHRGPAAGSAWEDWRAAVGDIGDALRSDAGGLRGLLPLLHDAVARNAFPVEQQSLSVLRTARLREEMRARTYAAAAGEVLSLLAAAGVEPLVLRGAALAGTVYERPELRHCHDLDLLVRPEELPAATAALACDPVHLLATQADDGAHAAHASGLPVKLHTRLFRIPYYDAPLEQLWRHREATTIGRTPASIPAPADMLVHVCGHAACSRSRLNLRWACDAWLLLAARGDLDWAVALDRVAASRLGLPLLVLLGYLADQLGAPVPPEVRAALARMAAATPAAGLDVALWGARAGISGGVRSLLRAADGWRSSATIARWCMAPTPSYLRWSIGTGSRMPLPLQYVWRPLRHLGRTVRGVRGSPPQLTTSPP
jgi:hypothetical protein